MMCNRRPPTTDLSADGLFDVLSDEHRRLVTGYLLRQDGPTGIERLADHIVERSLLAYSGQLEEPRRRVLTSLHHVHLPKLAEAGIVTYDADRNAAEATADAPIVEPYLELAKEHGYR